MSKQKKNYCAVTKDWFITLLFTTEKSNVQNNKYTVGNRGVGNKKKKQQKSEGKQIR